MTIAEWFKLLWPIAAVIFSVYIRLEVAQALSKMRHKSAESAVAGVKASSEKDLDHLKESVDKDIQAVHARVSRHETQTNTYLAEIRADIKTLLKRDQ